MSGEKGAPGANMLGPQGIKGFAGIEIYMCITQLCL